MNCTEQNAAQKKIPIILFFWIKYFAIYYWFAQQIRWDYLSLKENYHCDTWENSYMYQIYHKAALNQAKAETLSI